MQKESDKSSVASASEIDITSKLDNMNITSSKNQNKKWRQSQMWYKNGKKNECETYQLELVEKITGQKVNKTNLRFNDFTYELKDNKTPMMKNDGFDWTENLDGEQKINNNTLFYNCKFVCEKGGAQTRALRDEAYKLLKCQLEYLNQNKALTTTYFINILDGQESSIHINKFKFKLNNEKYKDIKKFVFVGDLLEFREWFKSMNLS